MTNPAITVIMSAYNSETFIDQAVQSILDQTFRDFEFILIDDASSDKTRNIIEAYRDKDNRIKPIFNSENLGLTKNLNVGLQHAKGRYIARLDADDIAIADRFQLQYEQLDQNPDLVLVGSNAIFINDAGVETGQSDLACEDFTIKATCLLENPFIHSSIMLRRTTLQDHQLAYDETCDTSQDYQLWSRLLAIGSAQNIKKPLIKFRYHENSISARKRDRQVHNTRTITQDYQAQSSFGTLAPLPFDLLQVGFLGDRATADAQGHDRIDACRSVLRLAKTLINTVSRKDSQEYRNRIYGRIVQMGLMPPLKNGWFSLLFSLIFSTQTPWPHLICKILSRFK